jgi:hypothetical protein
VEICKILRENLRAVIIVPPDAVIDWRKAPNGGLHLRPHLRQTCLLNTEPKRTPNDC